MKEKVEAKTLSVKEELQFLREREAAVTHFLYGIAFGIIISSIFFRTREP